MSVLYVLVGLVVLAAIALLYREVNSYFRAREFLALNAPSVYDSVRDQGRTPPTLYASSVVVKLQFPGKQVFLICNREWAKITGGQLAYLLYFFLPQIDHKVDEVLTVSLTHPTTL